MSNSTTQKAVRRLRRFSLRTLLAVTALVATCFAFAAKPYLERRTGVAAIGKWHGGYGIHLEGPNWLRDRVRNNKWFYNLGRVSIGPECDGYDPNTPFDDAALRDLIPHLNNFSEFRSLDIRHTPITDAGVRYKLKLNNLEQFYAHGTQISDIGLGYLTKFDGLRTVDVRETKVTAVGVEQFCAALPNCNVMWDD